MIVKILSLHSRTSFFPVTTTDRHTRVVYILLRLGRSWVQIPIRSPAILTKIFVFFSNPSGKVSRYYLKLDYDRFLPQPTQFILRLSFHSTLRCFQLLKQFSLRLWIRIVFRVYGLCFFPLFFFNKQLWSWRRSSLVISFRATGTNLIETRTEDNFHSFDFFRTSFTP